MRDRIFKYMHKSPQEGHRENLKTQIRIKKSYFWENMRKDINDKIQRCVICKLDRVKKRIKNPVMVTDTACSSFEKVSFDILLNSY